MRPLMEIATLRTYLDDQAAAAPWLGSMGLVDLRRPHGNLLRMATSGVPLDLLAVVCDQLEGSLASTADPDMALNNLDRFVAASRNPLALGTLFQRDPSALPTLLQIFSTSQHLSDLLVADPESFDLLRLSEGQPYARQALVEDITSEVAALEHDQTVLRALRRFKRREMLRISYGDIVREQSAQTVTAQISYLADAILEAALQAAWKKLVATRGTPRGPDGQPGPLRGPGHGQARRRGAELLQRHRPDLPLRPRRHDRCPPPADQRRVLRPARPGAGAASDRGHGPGLAYRVDLRLRPEGERGPMVISTPRP